MRKLTDRGGIVGCLRGCWKGFVVGFGLCYLERAQGSKTLLMPNTVFTSRPYFQSPKPVFTVPSGFCASFVKCSASFIIFIALYLGILFSLQARFFILAFGPSNSLGLFSPFLLLFLLPPSHEHPLQ